MNGSIVIVSCGTSRSDLTARHLEAVQGADVLAGGQRLLDWFPDFAGEKVVLAGRVEEAVAALVARSAGARIAVLASGDALFFGIGRLFAERAEPGRLEILPNVTAAQAALARLNLAWEGARFFSVHGRDSALPWRAILQAPLAAVYGDPVRTPAAIAAELIERWPASGRCPAAIVADLGAPGERCLAGTLAEMAEAATGGLAVLVVRADEACPTPPLSLGLEDEQYAREAELITHPEVRAVALSKLRLGPGVMWDVGAGSGSVGIEAAGLCDGLRVFAIEKNGARCGQIRRNVQAAGVSSVRVIEGAAPAAFEALPAPRAVFVGGGGADVKGIAEAVFAALRPGGTLVAAAVLLETRARLLECLAEYRVEILELEVRRAHALGPGHRLEPGNPIALHVYRKESR